MEDTANFLRQNPDGHTEFLVDRARAGSAAAWTEIWRRYRKMLVVQIQSRIQGYARRRFDEDDLLQEVFAKAWTHIQSFEYRGEGSFRRWLGTLIVNEFRSKMKSQPVEHVRSAPEDHHLSGEVDPDAPGQEQLAEDQATLLENMGQLDDEDRDLLSLRYFEDRTWDEIALVFECSRDTARQRFDRAMARLERRMGH